MATTDQKKQDDQAEFAAQFNAEDAPKKEPTEEEAFGEGQAAEPAPGAAAAPGAGAEAASAAAASAEPATAAPAPAPADPEQRLRSWEGRLKAREAELDAKEAALATTNVAEQQTGAAAAASADSGAAEDDPGKAIADDFGPEFLGQLTKLIEHICRKLVGDGIGSVSDTVQSVIDHLKRKETDNHFKSIQAAHADFMDIIESPEFAAWQAAQPPEKQADLQRVIESGSADEIIAMLTAFKQSKGAGDADDQALDAAEGVRSRGLTLPKEPSGADDFADAWNKS